MKNLKKILFIITMVIISSYIFLGCAGVTIDDEVEKDILRKQLIGTWEYKDEWGYSGVVIFEEDGSFYYESMENGKSSYKERGTFSLDEEKGRVTTVSTEMWSIWDDEVNQDLNMISTVTFMIYEDKLFIEGIFFGGNIETLIGKWENYSSYKNKNYTYQNYDYEKDEWTEEIPNCFEYYESVTNLNLKEDGTYKLKYTDIWYIEDENGKVLDGSKEPYDTYEEEGTWTYSEGMLEVKYSYYGEEETENIEINTIGNAFYLGDYSMVYSRKD